MPPFVNREHEIKIVEEAFEDLLSEERLLRTPILDFYGIEGVGKTSLLQQVVQKCDEKHVPHIWADADQNLFSLEQSIIAQAIRYENLLSSASTISEPSVAHHAKILLERGPLVLLFDSIDTTNEGQLVWLEDILSVLIVYNKLFVILSSKRSIAFEREKSIARKLKPVPVYPLDWVSSEAYLNHFQYQFKPEIRELIFEWTRGYPLAMNIMVETILKQGLDPTTAQGRNMLINIIVERVTAEGILSKVKREEHNWLNKALKLLSIPRRFNLIIMQKLIEEFEPDLKQGKSLSYLVLLRWITQATAVLSWKMDKAGFAIEDPIRHLLLEQWRIERPAQFHAINHFLADLNKNNASGPDRTRYQRDYLYHSANSVDIQQLSELLQQSIGQIIQHAEEMPDWLIQFVEEFEQDDELKEALGQHMTVAQHLLYEALANKMLAAYEQEENEAEKFRYLLSFFDYVIRDPEIKDIQAVLKEAILRLLQKEAASFLLKLYDELGQKISFKVALGTDFVVLRAIIQSRISAEG